MGLSYVGPTYYEDLYPVTFTLGALKKARLAMQTVSATQGAHVIRVEELPALNKAARASTPSDVASL
jgi:hypothetical protein